MHKRSKRLIAATTITAVVLLPAWAINVGWGYLDDCAVPPASAFPAVPDGTVVNGISMQGGSGGCWLAMSIEANCPEAAQVLTEMEEAGESCRTRNVLTLRKTCTGTEFGKRTGSIYLQYNH